jgi:hypothetical protein
LTIKFFIEQVITPPRSGGLGGLEQPKGLPGYVKS